jgi:hypothetical protein
VECKRSPRHPASVPRLFVGRVLLVDLVVDRLEHVRNIELPARDLLRKGNPAAASRGMGLPEGPDLFVDDFYSKRT